MSDDNMDIVENENDSESSEDDENMNEEEAGTSGNSKVYLPGKPLEEGEELICDESAYVMLHQAQTGAPCLSFDIIKDSLGNDRETFPLTSYIVAGTQAQQVHVNNIIVMKLSNLHKISAKDKDDEDEEEEDDDDGDEDCNPKMAGALMKHQGCVNRIRV